MKIAFITRHYNKRGGISRYVAELAERFAKDNEVHVFTSSWQDVGSNRIIFHKIPIISFRFLKRCKKYALNNIFEVISFMIFSCLRVNYSDFDIVHNQGDYIGKFDIYTAHSCHLAWLKTVKREKKSLIEKIKKSKFNPLHLLLLFKEKIIFSKKTNVISVSKVVKREIMKFYCFPENKINVIPNGVDIKKFNPENKKIFRKEIRSKYNIKEKDTVIIFPAHEFKRKGLLQIIEALKILKNNKIYLLVVGRDNPQPYFKLLDEYCLRNKVIFAGEVSQIEKYYAASDICVFPTLYEAFSLSSLEAVASGLPLLGTKVSGIEEIIKNGENGFFIKRDPQDIAEKLSILVQNKELCKKMGEEARKTAENYSWEKIARQTFELYQKILEEKSK